MVDDPVGTVKENWRVFLLILILAGSLFALFSPTLARGGAAPGTADSGPTNLQYGLQLSGGTRIRAPLVAVHATDVDFGNDNISTVERRVAANLEGISRTDVTARPPGQYRGVTQSRATVEVTAANVTPAELGSALSDAGYTYDETVEGATAVTRQIAVDVLRTKINEAGLSGGSVQSVSTSTGEHFILIEVPNENRSSVLDLVESRGKVTIQAYYQPEGSSNYTRQIVLTADDFSRIGAAQQGQGARGPYVPVVVKDSEAERFQQAMVDTGLAQQGGTNCRYRENPESTEPCLLVVQDDRVVNAFGMSPDLARSMRAGEWAEDPNFVLTTTNYSEAQELAVNLRAGALPAKLDVGPDGEGSSMYVSAAQSEGFKRDSLIAGLFAVLAVAGVVFLRYGRVEVAAPMLVTALSEVVILMGFAAAVGYPLDLSVIAGFIAAIGTGVDDLIIIADEVMAEGDVSSRRVFQSRFRRAFWVIGAAAATTIIALSPLAVLSLGDLKGFAIFTILGVIVGVLVTRPAYGDILRQLLTENR